MLIAGGFGVTFCRGEEHRPIGDDQAHVPHAGLVDALVINLIKEPSLSTELR
jgi:hypothetical protein